MIDNGIKIDVKPRAHGPWVTTHERNGGYRMVQLCRSVRIPRPADGIQRW